MKQLLSLFLAVCMVVGLFTGIAPQATAAASAGVEVSTPDELQEKLDAGVADKGTVLLS